VIGNPHSSIFDSLVDQGSMARLVKVLVVVRQRVGILEPGRGCAAEDGMSGTGTMLHKRSVRDLEPAARRVLVRVDFKRAAQERRGVRRHAHHGGAAHDPLPAREESAGRPHVASWGGPTASPIPSTASRRWPKRLERLLRQPVAFASDCIGEPAERTVAALTDGGVALLENLRFHAEEEKNDAGFARQLAGLGDCYVNDAFGTAHRAHASTEGVRASAQPAVAGFLMQKELEYLGRRSSSRSGRSWRSSAAPRSRARST
jgi:phosphoglycerate kinase